MDFNFRIEGDKLVVNAGTGKIAKLSSSFLQEIGPKIDSSIVAEKLPGGIDATYALKIPFEFILKFVSVADAEIKNFYLQDFLRNGWSVASSHETPAFLSENNYDRLKTALKDAKNPLAESIIAPKKAQLYKYVINMVFKDWKINEKKNETGSIYNDYTEVLFLIDCLLNLKENEEGILYCNPRDCITYLEIYDTDKKYSQNFKKEMTWLFKAIHPELELQSTTDLHQDFSFTKEGSEILKKLLNDSNCIDYMESLKKVEQVELLDDGLIKRIDNLAKGNEPRVEQRSLGDEIQKLYDNFNEILKQSLDLRTLLENAYATNAAYYKAKKAASLFHEQLSKKINDFKEKIDVNNPLSLKMNLDIFVDECKSSCEIAKRELSQHRGLWYSIDELLRAILGVLAGITIIPALLVEAFSPYQFMGTFFNEPKTNSEKSMDEIKENICSLGL